MGGQKSEKDGMLHRFGARQGAGAGQDYDLVRGRKQHRCFDILPALTDGDSQVAHATEVVGAARFRD